MGAKFFRMFREVNTSKQLIQPARPEIQASTRSKNYAARGLVARPRGIGKPRRQGRPLPL